MSKVFAIGEGRLFATQEYSHCVFGVQNIAFCINLALVHH